MLIFVWNNLLEAYPGKVIHHFPAPDKFSTGLTFDGKNLWVADHRTDSLTCINQKSGEVVNNIPSPGFWPMGLTWDGKYLWNVDKKEKKIYKVDPKDGTVLVVLDCPTRNPDGLTWDGKTLWIGDSKTNEIMRLDLSDGTALKKIVGPANTVQGLTYDGQYIWCSDRRMDEIYMLDPESGEVLMILKSPAPYPRGLAWDGQYLWNVDYQSDEIYQLIWQDDEKYKLGDKRIAEVTLTHEVKVEGSGFLRELEFYISLPEDRLHQKIISKKLIPDADGIVEDQWDQKFAAYKYIDEKSPQVIQTSMIVETEISEISYFIFPDKCGTLSDIPQNIRERYTTDGSKYQIDDPIIQNLVKKIVGPEKNPYWIARKIFNCVGEKLEYKMEGGWNIAPFVLERGTGSCSEYTFSFIALCRAAGLPARYVGCLKVRYDDASIDEAFHRWPEIYLPNYGWIPIDPQCGDAYSKPRDAVRCIGHLTNKVLITLQGGGDSKYLGWYYISSEKYKTDSKITVKIDKYAIWEPLGSER